MPTIAFIALLILGWRDGAKGRETWPKPARLAVDTAGRPRLDAQGTQPPSDRHMACAGPRRRLPLLSSLQHQAADRLVPLDPRVVVCLRPVAPQKVGEGLQEDGSDERIV